MMIRPRTLPLLPSLLLLLLRQLSGVASLQPCRPNSAFSRTRPLASSRTESNILTPPTPPHSTALPAPPTVLNSEQVEASWITQPIKGDESLVVGSPDAPLADAELVVGRLAMVGALGILFREVFTGESILEQFLEFSHQASTL